jgi:hypothetical protein
MTKSKINLYLIYKCSRKKTESVIVEPSWQEHNPCEYACQASNKLHCGPAEPPVLLGLTAPLLDLLVLIVDEAQRYLLTNYGVREKGLKEQPCGSKDWWGHPSTRGFPLARIISGMMGQMMLF